MFPLFTPKLCRGKSDQVDMTSHSGRSSSALTPLSTYLVLYLFFSAQVMSGSSAAQKFYPNGRYGRRSDLPPLLSLANDNNKYAMVDSVLGQEALGNKDSIGYVGANVIEEFVPMWCAEVDRKLNLFRCFDRFPLKLLRQPKEAASAHRPQLQTQQPQDQQGDQQQS